MEKLGNVIALPLTVPFKIYPRKSFVFELTIKDSSTTPSPPPPLPPKTRFSKTQEGPVRGHGDLLETYRGLSIEKEYNMCLQFYYHT